MSFMDTVSEPRGLACRKTVWILALVYFLLATPSCSLKRAVKKCSFKVHKVAIKDFSNQGFKAVVTFKIRNPNWFGLKVKQLEYVVFVNDEELGTGKSEGVISIGRRSKSYVDIPLQMELTELSGSLLKFFISGKMEYSIKGKAVFSTFLGDIDYPFDLTKNVKDFKKRRLKI